MPIYRTLLLAVGTMLCLPGAGRAHWEVRRLPICNEVSHIRAVAIAVAGTTLVEGKDPLQSAIEKTNQDFGENQKNVCSLTKAKFSRYAEIARVEKGSKVFSIVAIVVIAAGEPDLKQAGPVWQFTLFEVDKGII